MAINKEKNVCIQVTFSKEDANNLDNLVMAFNKNGIKTSRSDVLAKSFNEYLKMIVYTGTATKPTNKTMNKEENKDD